MHPWKYLGFWGPPCKLFSPETFTAKLGPKKKDGGPQNRIWDRLENPWDS